MPKEINLRIVLQNPVDGIMYGLQKRKAPNYETVQAQLGNGVDLIFDFTIQVKEANGSPNTFSGPFVQGPAGHRFIYIGVGSYAGQSGALLNGRMKIPLPESTFQNALSNDDNSFWFCTVPGRTGDGKPVFATVKPFGGWSIHKQFT